MIEGSLRESTLKKDWQLDARAFQRLLVYLDAGLDSEGEGYLEMHRRLVHFFDRKNCLAPYDLADETLNRVARRLEEADAIQSDNPARYCYIVARFVFQEYLRRNKNVVDYRELPGHSNNPEQLQKSDEKRTKEQLLHCLDQCTSKLDSLSQRIISRYYVGKERVKIDNRRALAAELGISINALAIRACRIRQMLEICVRECSSKM